MTLQMDLFIAHGGAGRNSSRENEHGMLMDWEAAQLLGKPSAPRYGGSTPIIAKVMLAFADGGYHWAVSVHTSTLGFGSCPARKWRQFSTSRAIAIADAATLTRRNMERCSSAKDRQLIARWLDQVEAGAVDFDVEERAA